jgi:hypothetical protein
MDLTNAHWAVPSKSNARLHILWHEGGPPVCQRKQALQKVFKNTILTGKGMLEANRAGVSMCPNCARKCQIPLS